MMPRDAVTTPLILVGMFTFLGILLCVSAYSGAAESKRMTLVHQEDGVHVARR